MPTSRSRLVFIDFLKAFASQLIVLHHLAFYGPLSDVAMELAPTLIGWLSEYARIAVQVFLVVGGFLAARGLAPTGTLVESRPMMLLLRRYLRLAPPFVAALGLAMAGAALARVWLDHDSIPGAPSATQVLAHVALLHNILDVDALSAGVWYIAIDFQLFALLVLVLWAARGIVGSGNAGAAISRAMVFSLALASLFYFNRNAEWDIWGLYFVGAYGMGALAFWASDRSRSPWRLGLVAVAAIAALVVDFRLRIAVALVTALVLGIARRTGWMERCPEFRPVTFLSRISYSLFLVHFPVCLVVNAAFTRYAPETPAVSALGMGVAWLGSLVAGTLFHTYVESRVWRRPPVPVPATAPAAPKGATATGTLAPQS